MDVVRHHGARHGLVLPPRRWVVERTFAWAARFWRLARNYERLADTLATYRWAALVSLWLRSFFARSP